MTRSARFRGWVILWAVLQFALPLGASLADARLERESAASRSGHVESGTADSCRPPHSQDCALCQLLSRGAAPGRCTAPAFAQVVRSHAAAEPASSRPARDLAPVALPRAPPARPA